MVDQPPIIRALLDPAAYAHAAARVELVETHISWVLLTGEFAYKIKKPVRLDFVDFSTLELRQAACLDELRLNGRFAPQIYLDVVAITGSPSQPLVGGSGEPIEFAVKMVQFPSEERLDRVLAAGRFQAADCDRLAATIAESHRRAAVAATNTPFGQPATIAKQIGDVLGTAVDQTRGGPDEGFVSALALSMERERERLTPAFETRKAGGWVRECHGDLHSENIVILDGESVPFDCLEFREDLRWIDCASDVAFVTMDLSERGQSRFANRLLNAYIEQTGDVEGLSVMRFYQAYRAAVRAVVTTLQRATSEPTGHIADRARTYFELAERYLRPPRPALVITHGVSGTGKTTATQELLEQLGAIRLRSDMERRREDQAVGSAHATPQNGEDRYTMAARQAVYDALLRKADIGVKAGYRILVDATFLQRAHRDAFRQLAERWNVPFVILAFDADPATLRQRIEERRRVGNDASEATLAVLEQQLAEREPLEEDEREHVVAVHGGAVGPALRRLSENTLL